MAAALECSPVLMTDLLGQSVDDAGNRPSAVVPGSGNSAINIEGFV